MKTKLALITAANQDLVAQYNLSIATLNMPFTVDHEDGSSAEYPAGAMIYVDESEDMAWIPSRSGTEDGCWQHIFPCEYTIRA